MIFSFLVPGEEMEKPGKNTCLYLICLFVTGCIPVEDNYADKDKFTDSGSAAAVSHLVDTTQLMANKGRATREYSPGASIDTRNVTPEVVVAFAQTLVGTPYKYASTDPKAGFDCSGFITYVFNHFDIAVPRSSADFTDVGKVVPKPDARPGDLILFTGTNNQDPKVGHMGIVTFNSPDTLLFIHSTSGKMNSVTVTPFNEYYQSRFVKVIRIFNDNNKARR